MRQIVNSNFKSAYLSVENSNTVKILKTVETDGHLVKNEWSFDLHRVYERELELDEVFRKEIKDTQYFNNFFNDFKSNMFLVMDNSGRISINQPLFWMSMIMRTNMLCGLLNK